MTEARPIVVGVDASPDSDRATTWALNEARQARCGVLLVHSFARPLLQKPDVMLQEERDRTDEILAHAESLAAEFPDVPVSVQRLEGLGLTPAAALVQASEQAAAIVLGALGHGGFAGMLLGSVSQHVARHATCPVVTVREPADPRTERVVVGVDDSKGSQDALEFALQRAQGSGGEVVAIHAWRAAALHGAGVTLPLPEDATQQQGLHQDRLEEWLAPWRQKSPSVSLTAEAIPGHAGRALIDASEHAALVVVGSRGRGAFAGLLLGSVSQTLIHHGRCPVAVAR